MCEKVLKQPGALIFSPPLDTNPDHVDFIKKYHICLVCWAVLQGAITDMGK